MLFKKCKELSCTGLTELKGKLQKVNSISALNVSVVPVAV
jgi:hypothetical protein